MALDFNATLTDPDLSHRVRIRCNAPFVTRDAQIGIARDGAAGS